MGLIYTAGHIIIEQGTVSLLYDIMNKGDERMYEYHIHCYLSFYNQNEGLYCYSILLGHWHLT